MLFLFCFGRPQFAIATVIIRVSVRIRIILKSAAGYQYHDHCGVDEWI
jgi:hypothetical protein